MRRHHASVAAHLGITLADYDRRIRTFIPHYDEMLAVVAGVPDLLARRSSAIVDLGVGTGALAARCLAGSPRATLTGIDADPEMLAAAARRLRSYDGRIRLIHGTFLKIPLPRADAFVATLALHHIRTAAAKQRFYRRCHAALRPGGILASGDAFLADDPRLERAFMTAWVRHMARTYRAARARRFLRSWAGEDRYFPLGREMEMLRRAGFRVEVAWRRAPFAVLIGRKAGAG